MGIFSKLIYNELIKIYVRKSTWIIYLILLVIIIGSGILNKTSLIGYDARTLGDDWREVLQVEIDNLKLEQDEMGANEIDSPEFELIEANQIYLEENVKPSGFGAWRFVVESVNLLITVALLTIIVAAGIVADEYRWGTIKLLLIRPISRTTILLSKYIAVLLFSLITLLFVLFFAWIIGAILFGIEAPSPQVLIMYYEMNQGKSEITYQLISTYNLIIEGYGYVLVELIMMTTLAFMISTVFRTTSMAIGTAISLLFAGGAITGILIRYSPSFTKYTLFINMDLRQYADGNPMIEGMTIHFSMITLLIYYILFILLSWVFFVKRDVG